MSGVCTGKKKSCPAPDNCHGAGKKHFVKINEEGTCDSTTGQCGNYTALDNGTTCNDGNACTQKDQCISGVCVGSNPVECVPPSN